MSRVSRLAAEAIELAAIAELISIIPPKHVDCSATRMRPTPRQLRHGIPRSLQVSASRSAVRQKKLLAIVFIPARKVPGRCGARRQRYAGNLFQSQFLARCGRRAIAARVGRLRLYAGAQLLE